MGVQKDAGELLLFFYDELVNKGKSSVGTREVINATKWEGKRINLAYNYLDDLGILKSHKVMGNINGAQIFFVTRILPEGINIIENQSEFKRTFGFEVNLLFLKFSWSIQEKQSNKLVRPLPRLSILRYIKRRKNKKYDA